MFSVHECWLLLFQVLWVATHVLVFMNAGFYCSECCGLPMVIYLHGLPLPADMSYVHVCSLVGTWRVVIGHSVPRLSFEVNAYATILESVFQA